MKNGAKYHGAVVPMVTPITPQGTVDEPALKRLVDSLVAGRVEGIFVLGTTGEGAHVPRGQHLKLVELCVQRASRRALVFVGLGDVRLAEMDRANEFFKVGADAVVAHPPISEKVVLEKLGGWYRTLLERLTGPLLVYNMPATTGVSIPLDAVESLLGHPRLAGIKDSENNPQRVEELLKRFGGKKDFSVFIGVGALMEKGLKLGADGIVPSVGNLIPEVCHQLCVAAQTADWHAAGTHYARMNAVAALYQKGRTLNESLAALKAAVHCRGLCAPAVLPPLHVLPKLEVEKIRSQMAELHLLNGTA
ncbi:MAG: dihydrodipicolinate synthase family protein [Verrucomicrobiae bacterium]|nr:dihydrodipicolinate synthase family protein [Verrucomicrobiae bacterium]